MAGEDVSTLRQQLSSNFGGVLDEKLLEQCVTLCQCYNITAEELLYKWEAMSFGTSPRVFNSETISGLNQYIVRELTKQNAHQLRAKSTASGLMSRNLNARVLPTPTPARPRADLGAYSRGTAGPSKVSFEVENIDSQGRKERRYRYMYEKLSERSGALDDRIDDIAEVVQNHYGILELGDPSNVTQEEVIVVGRVVIDADSSSVGPVKLNEASLTLESSRAMGSGKRVPLKFDTNVRVRGARKGVQGAGVFPGAIVALRGRNGGGDWFLVTEILSLPSPLPRQRVPGDPHRNFSMCIASGPYTTDGDLKFEAWEGLLKKLRITKPAVVMLIGPFVDSAHPFIQDGEMDRTPEALFQEIFLNGLSELLDDLPGSIALIVPSVRDVISDHAVFPQCALQLDVAQDPRIVMLPNPCRFTINDTSFGVCSVDTLFHLRKEEFFKRASEIAPIGDEAQPPDSMANLCRHILQQRSFYPIFPVPLDATHEVNLDASHLEFLDICADNGSAPDVLVFSSRLKHFVKNIDDVVVINNPLLLKGNITTFNSADQIMDCSIKFEKLV